MDLNGTSAIVTGGASGLGLATSRLLAERGVRVVVADLQEDKGVPLAKEIGGLFVQTEMCIRDSLVGVPSSARSAGPHLRCRAEDRGRPGRGHICSGASMPSSESPSSSTRAVRSQSPSLESRTVSSSTSTRQAS